MKILWPVITFIVAALIFYSSSMSGETSGQASLVVANLFGRIIPLDDPALNFFVRKSAHFFVYLVLAFSLGNSIKYYFTNKKAVLLTAWLGASIYGITDEIHQYFVPGRVMSVMDMAINSAGALLGAFIVYLIFKGKPL